MAVALWRSKSAFDKVEIGFAYAATISAAATTLLPPEQKTISAGFTCVFALIVALSKWRSKTIDEREKLARAKQESDDKTALSKALSVLKSDAEAEKLNSLNEVAAIRDKLNNQLRTAIRVVLEDFHDRYFHREADKEKHKHRTTLFTCVESNGNPGRDKRLIIYVRIGVHRESQSSWPVDDDDLERCRGVAGKIWFHGSGNVTSTDCDWPSDEANVAQKAAYASSLGITVDEAQALRVKSKVFTGARIMARDRKWGVILLDSVKDGHITDATDKRKLLAQYTNLISSIVNRMES
jgi:hypothetical protein